jgi:hypothetical protein
MTPDAFQFLATLNLPDEVITKLRSVQSPALPHREILLRRLSLPRTFTEKVYQAAVGDLSLPPAFKAFTDLPEVEPLIGWPGRFVIHESVRSENFRHWLSESQDRKRWADTFASVLDPSDEIEVLDRLQFLFLADQSVARQELRDAFEDADRKDDMPRCAALVQLAASVILMLGEPESKVLLRELQARQQSRNLFYTEFYQTAKYFQRGEIEGKLGAFISATTSQLPSQQWIFHLHATGGMGKTTLLRRLISHEWVTRSKRLPCAWIDFDYLDVGTILIAPWLLALPIAAQWNEQLEKPLFGSLLEPSFQPLASLLFRARADRSATGLSNPTADSISLTQYRAGRSNPMRCGMLAGAVPPQSLEERKNRLDSARFFRTLWDEKFPRAVASMPAERPILLFLDTLEEASLRHSQELRAILSLLKSLRDRIQKIAQEEGKKAVDLKLILSGRHQLGVKHLPEFRTDFRGEYEDHALEGLGDLEATAFLKERIDPRQHELIPAMVKKSLGIPFHLSLFAEWAKDDPNLEKKTVEEESEEITAVMLIERIIKRIPYEPLHWIIRYGVVPRTLSVDFLRDVMREPLIDALSGKATAEGRDRLTSPLEKDAWRQEKDFQFNAQTLWDQHVLPYASAKGWMIPGENDAKQVGFRSDILQPMRKLLRRQVVFEDLHTRARDWFEDRSKKPESWATAMVEYFYHCSQLRSVPSRAKEDLLPAIRTALDAPALRDNPALRRLMAEALRNPGFEELTNPEKAYLEYRIAEAIAAELGYSYANEESTRHLWSAFDFAGNESAKVLPPFAHEWSKAAQGAPVSTFHSRLEELPTDDAVQLAMLIAESTRTRSPVAEEVLGAALDLWKPVPQPTVSRGAIEERLARYLQVWEPEAAIRHFESAAEDFAQRGNAAKRSDLLRLAAAAQLNLGRLTRAEAILQSLTTADSRTASVGFQLARLELAKGQAGRALEYLQEFSGSSFSNAEQMEALLLRAEGLSQRLLWQEAREVWQRARDLADKSSDSGVLVRSLIGQVKLDRWWLRRTDRSTLPSFNQNAISGAAPTLSEELDIWQIAFGGDPEAAHRRTFGELGGNSPTGKIRLIFAVSQVVSPFPESRWQEVLKLAEELPRSARLAALVEPALLGSPARLSDNLRRQMAEAFRHEPEGEIEAAWYAIRNSELLAWLGFHEEAAAILRQGVPVLKPSPTIEAWKAATYRERRRIEQRIRDWGASDVRAEPDPADLWRSVWPHTPFRWAAATIENAQCAFDAKQFDVVKDSLELAMPVLGGTPFETAFHETARKLKEAMEGPVEVAGGASFTGPEETLLPFTILALRAQAGRLATRLSGEAALEVLVSAESETLEALLRARGIPRRLISQSPTKLSNELREILEQTGAALGGPQRLWLRMPLSALSAAPWELAFWESRVPPPWRAPSGWQDAQARQLEADWRAARMRGPNPAEFPPKVELLILQPLSPQDKESPAIGAYLELSNRFETRTSLQTLYAGAREIHLLYLASSFVELPSLSEPAIAGWEITASAFAQNLEKYGGRPRPAVILDVPAVRSWPDFVHQLLLRNYFAQALLDSGTVRCVLATGLYQDPHIRLVHALLTEAADKPWLTQSGLLDSLARDSQHTEFADHDALFSVNPDLSLIKPITEYA